MPVSALEQYKTLARTEFGSPFLVGRSGTVYLNHETTAVVPDVTHDEQRDIIVWSPIWEVFSKGYTGQHGYNGGVMHASEQLSGRLADDILTTPGTYVVCEVSVMPDEDDPDDTDPAPAGWTVLKLIDSVSDASDTPNNKED